MANKFPSEIILILIIIFLFYYYYYYYFLSQDDTCRFKKSAVGATCTGFVDIPSGDEDALKKAVATIGPISVAIDASHDSFQTYE